jgi:hypothetical protein
MVLEMKVSDIKDSSGLYNYIEYHQKRMGEMPSGIVLPEKIFDQIVKWLPFTTELVKRVFACKTFVFMHVPVFKRRRWKVASVKILVSRRCMRLLQRSYARDDAKECS